MANCAKAFFAGQRLLRQVFENSNVMLVNRYNGNLALLSSSSDFHAILGAKTVNEHLCKSLLMQTRSYSKYNSFKHEHNEVECRRLSKLNGNIAKPGRNTPLVKHSVGKYFDLCGKAEKNKKEVSKIVREPPKARQNHAYFMQRTIFNCSTTYDKNKHVKKQPDIKPAKLIGYKSNTQIKSYNKEKIDGGILEGPEKDILKKSSVHTLYRKNFDRSQSLHSDSSRTSLNKILHCEKYKDLSILFEAPSRHGKVSDARQRKEPSAPRLTQNLIKMTHWERHAALQEKLQAKGILKLTDENHKHLKGEDIKNKELESNSCDEKCDEIKNSPIKKETMETHKQKNSINKDNPEFVESKGVKESKLNDLDPNEMYAETWTKAKLNSLCKLFNITEFSKASPVKTQSEAIYIPELRELNPHEFYDFHANFRPIKKENAQLQKSAKIDTKVNKSVFLKPNLEQPCKGFHCKPLLDTKEAHQEESADDLNKKKNSNKTNISEALNSILYEENNSFQKNIPNISVSKIQATYIWVSGNDLSVKDRILTKIPKTVLDLPEWTSSFSDGSKNKEHNKDFSLVPKQYYNNPLKPKDGSLLILCDTENKNEHMSKRASCLKTIKKYIDEEPWFAFAQEYVVLTMDGKPLCANNARESAMAKELAQAHVDACLFAGLPFFAMAQQKVPGKWEYQVGPSFGINAADDLWVSRYLLKRLAEKKKLRVSFDPKCVEKVTMEIGTKINFSTENMRKDNGIKHIMNAVNRLGDHHSILNSIYKQRREKKFTWDIGRTNVSVRIPKTTVQNGRGYLQDRRPAGDSDPYQIAEAIIKVCLTPYENESRA